MSFKYPWMFFFILLQIIVILILKYKKNDLSSSLPNASEKVLRTLEEKLDKHIIEIWTVYKPIKELLKRLEKFKLW